MFIDPDGRYRLPAGFSKYKKLSSFMKRDGLLDHINNRPQIGAALKLASARNQDGTPYITDRFIQETYKTVSGPKMELVGTPYFNTDYYIKFHNWERGKISNEEFLQNLKDTGRENLIPDVSGL